MTSDFTTSDFVDLLTAAFALAVIAMMGVLLWAVCASLTASHTPWMY